jgi:hypothetical protein
MNRMLFGHFTSIYRVALASFTILAAILSLGLAVTQAEVKPATQASSLKDGPPIIRTSYGMVLPQPRPDPRSVFPETEPSLRIFLEVQTGIAIEREETLYQLKSGEGLSNLLNRAGFSGQMREDAIKVIKAHRSLRNLPIGFPVYAIAPTETTPGGIRLSLNDEQDLSLYYHSDAEEWRALRSYRPYEYFLTFVSGEIDQSLYVSGTNAGMTDAMFSQFIQIMSFSVDFQRQIRSGDKFEALVEFRRDMVTDKVIPGGEIYFLSMTLSGDRIEYFRHENLDGKVGYYDRNGTSAYRTLMRTPINGARLSSGFGNRKHPVLGYTKAHRGIDFSAPTGTPIMAAGDGLVEYAGWNGSYGRYIRIVHNGTYKTAYAHLSRISRDIRKGDRVQQGEIIGYVGSTGRSTGPHLHYEILANGRQVNPLTIELPSGEGLNHEEMDRLADNIDKVTEELLSRGAVLYAEKR